MNNRLGKLRSGIDELGLDAILVSKPENRRYLSGFTGSAGYLLVTANEALLATDFRYVEQAKNQATNFEIVRSTDRWSWLKTILDRLNTIRIGVEADHMSISINQQLISTFKDVPHGEKPVFVPTNSIIETQRTIKDPNEIRGIKTAIEIADTAMMKVTSTIHEGQTEKEVAWNLEKTMRELGADGPSFDTIVASGPNGAMPHHRPSDRTILRGDPIVIDMGAQVNGYCSDITRTICIGDPSETFHKVYDTVLGAQLTAIELIKPGVSGEEADSYARDVINASPYAETFGHSLGHGVGLAVHELPTLGPKSAQVLEKDMVFTIEPGIYISGWGGVRIEDMVLLNTTGVDVLSTADK